MRSIYCKSDSTHCVKQRLQVNGKFCPLLRKVNALNIFQIYIYRHLTFICKFNNSQVPSIFCGIIKHLQHKYSRKFSSNSFYMEKEFLKLHQVFNFSTRSKVVERCSLQGKKEHSILFTFSK